MAATALLSHLIGINISHLSHEETLILEAEIFSRLYDELKNSFKAKSQAYFRLFKFTQEMENTMLEETFARCVINDILSTEEHTLSGIACYTQMPEDIIYDIARGQNTSPSAKFLKRIIELHHSVRRDLYGEILKKITTTP